MDGQSIDEQNMSKYINNLCDNTLVLFKSSKEVSLSSDWDDIHFQYNLYKMK